MKRLATSFRWIFLMIIAASTTASAAESRSEISQYGVTWTFDKAYPAGQFVTGDWWVVGPVKVIKVTPEPGPAPEQQKTEVKKNQFGDAGLKDDRTMRNGSMIVTRIVEKQGYDSRLINYDAALSQKFPLTLEADRSLISSISNDDVAVPNFVADIMWPSEKKSQAAMKTAAVLTCLKEVPPADAFRPPYVGTDKPIYRTSQLKWDKLLSLKTAGKAPSFEQYTRYLQRPWLDHTPSWLIQLTGPSENMPTYGREFARVSSVATLLLNTDTPKEQKEPLLIGLVQLGIDFNGLSQNGRVWLADGGHWSGRKWPILFAGLMLDDKQMIETAQTADFQEDQQTYYGQGWAGQTALWQMVTHHGPRQPYEEKSPDQWDDMDKRSESYRLCCNARAWAGTALAAQLMKARAAWNHDAFFDYVDRFMSPEDPYAAQRGEFKRPRDEASALDDFVNAMWKEYRAKVPEQAKGTTNRKWVWEGEKKDQGKWVANDPPK